MLPFTKRPGRGEQDGDVFTKDDLANPASVAPPARSVPPPPRSVPPPPFSEHPRKPAASISDDEVTTFLPSKSIGAAMGSARPATVPPPARRAPNSVPPPAMSSRPGKFITGQDEDDEGRTVVRGAPKIVRRSAPASGANMGLPTTPTTISPAAVIKATLESARAAKRDGLMAPPPAELLEDSSDMHPADAGQQHTVAMPATPSTRPPPHQSHQAHQGHNPYTAPMGMTPMGVTELGATMLAGVQPLPQPAPSVPPPPSSYASNYPPPYAPGSTSVPGVAMPSSMPAHFHVPHAPYSDGRIDPPATSVTARHKVAGRPASAWAMALVAAGLFVGVGAVAVMQSNDSLMDTTASFVDPSRAGKPAAAAPAAQPVPVAEPTPAPVAQPAVGVAPTVVVPPVAGDPAAAAAPAPVATTATPGVTPGVIGASQPAHAAQPAPAPQPVAAAAPAPKPQAPVAAAPAPAPAPKPAPVAVAAPTPKAAAPAAKPAPAPASDDATAEAKPAKGPKKGAKGAASDGTDEETKKALEALQKAQLESGF